MGDPRRFYLFANLIEQHISRDLNIVDVSGGKGYLQAALYQRGYRRITSWDKRHKYVMNRRGHRYGYFHWEEKTPYDALIAMHPDEGTDHSILYAAKHQIPALVCPCCIKPSAEVYWGQHSFGKWYEHLENLAILRGCSVLHFELPMNGRNKVMVLNLGKEMKGEEWMN